MSYRRAEEILPMEIIELIQQYVDGENIYIPKKEGKRLGWGVQSGARQEIVSREKGSTGITRAGSRRWSWRRHTFCLSRVSSGSFD